MGKATVRVEYAKGEGFRRKADDGFELTLDGKKFDGGSAEKQKLEQAQAANQEAAARLGEAEAKVGFPLPSPTPEKA